MYICKECNSKYKIKPDYCDCGNDTFDYVEDKPTPKPLTLEEKSEFVSRVFFAICLLMAILVWFIPVGKKPSENKGTAPKVQKLQPVGTIPDINRIWNDTPAYMPKTVEQQSVTQPVIPSSEPIILTPTGSFPEQKKNLIQPKKEINKTQPLSTKPKEQVNTGKKQVVTLTPKHATTSTTKPVQKVKPTQPKKIEAPKPVYNPKSPVMIEYKTKLRATLFSKFAVGSIKGSGTCAISFSVDKNGKLINRKFTKESDNKSLNDAVYYMLMSVPYFSAPPAEYNGSPINMTFSIDNGNYEIAIY